ncbi:MAG: hypothetical protein ACK5OB_12385 [Pirellula sp.]|jgi:hypothetical protein
MSCVHLKELDRLCHDHQLEISRSDMVRLVCTECGEHEVCPCNRMPEDGLEGALDGRSEVASAGQPGVISISSDGPTDRS